MAVAKADVVHPSHSIEPGAERPPTPRAEPPPPGRGRALLLTVLLVGAVAALAFALRRGPSEVKEPQSAAGERGGGGRGGGKGGGGKSGAPGDRPVPVLAATAEPRDVPVFLEGLGSVAAFNTVTVRSQVEGRITRIAFREGQEVKRGDLIAEIDPRPFELALRRAEAARDRDQALFENARQNLERTVKLRTDKLVPEQQLDDLTAAMSQAKATVDLDETAIAEAKLQLAYTRITAPIDGRTGVRLIDAGNLVHAGDPTGIVIITELDPIAVLFTLPQDDLPDVSTAMAHGTLGVEAFSRDGKTSLATGEVALIDNQINASTGTIRLKAIFRNPARSLWPNQFVKARLLVTTKRAALVVPAVAVQRGPSGTFTYVIGSEKKVEARPIEVELITQDLAVITRGIEAGEQVVVDGQYRLAPGAKVEVKTAQKNEPETGTVARSGEGH